MGKHNIEKNTLPYRLTYLFSVVIHNLIYREFYVVNRPEKSIEKPSIITPNHQNALMDAMAVLFAKNEPLVFLARSDIFKQKAVAAILHFLKILPVYRIRDGFDSLKNNQQTFDHTVRVLTNKRGLVILPEGNHFGAKKLRPLKKGFGRIAFMTEIHGNEEVDLQIVPTAIDYTSYDSFFARLTVFFGEPFPLQPYMAEYKENPQKALNSITKKLAQELKSHIIHIENDEYYEDLLLATAVYAEHQFPGNTNTIQKERYVTQRESARILNETENQDQRKFQDIVETASKIRKITGNIPHEFLGKKASAWSIPAFLLATMLIPLALPGTLIYGLFWFWPVFFVKKNIKDVQFRTSFRYGLYVAQFFLLLLGILIYLLISFPLKSALILFATTILSGILSIKLWRLFYWTMLKMRWFVLNIRHKDLSKHRQKLLDDMGNLKKHQG